MALAAFAYAQKQTIVSTPNYTAFGQDINAAPFVQTGSGSPVGAVACSQPGIDEYYDTAGKVRWQCTAAGSTSTAQWALINPPVWGAITGVLANQSDLGTALASKEPALGNPSVNGYVLASTTSGGRSWVPNGTGGGSSLFTSFQFGTQAALTGSNLYVQMTFPSLFTLTQTGSGTSGSPYVAALGLASQTQNCVVASPNGSAGAPGCRALVVQDLPTIPYSQLSGAQASLGFTPENAANKGAANGYAGLDSGSKVQVTNLPTIPYSQTSGVQASLGFTPENAANKGAASGYAPLDGTSKVPLTNLPTIPYSQTSGITPAAIGAASLAASNTFTTGTQDFHGAQHTLPAVSGLTASRPATCTVGEEYFATDAAAGQNMYYCTATNIWTQQIVSVGTGPTTATLTYGAGAPCSGTFPCQQTVTMNTGSTLVSPPLVVVADSTTNYGVPYTLCGWTSTTACIQLASAATVKVTVSNGGAGPQGSQGLQGPAGSVSSVTHTCIISNDTQSTTALTAPQFSGQCEIAVSGTITEIDVVGGSGTVGAGATTPTFTGTSSVQVGKYTPSTAASNTALMSAPLATVAGKACAYTTTSTTCPGMGITSSGSVTVSTVAVTKGDVLFVSAATPDTAQTWIAITIVYSASN